MDSRPTAQVSSSDVAGDLPESNHKELRLGLSHYMHQRMIGYLGLLLPVILVVLAAARPTPGLSPWRPLDSVSAYYYSGAVAVFIGVLFAMSLFLLSYQGYVDSRADRVLGKIGGGAALLIALFPTGAPEGLDEPAWWREWVGWVHYFAAISLFVVFILFALWLFRKTGEDPEQLSAEKRRKNLLFLVCGIVMTVAVVWAGSSLVTGKPIFWPEVIALSAFALSWLVKGEAYRPALRGLQAATEVRRKMAR
jgi:hypothetical protein